nr:flagellar filament capping protein FliD [uncultured Caproiciproducens sp.]
MISTTSSSIASSLNATSTSSKRLSGLVSGLDTDTLVKQLTMGTQNKIDKQSQNKQIALWRQQSYREVTTALQEFQTKYFSSSTSSSSILNASFFNSTSIKNTSSFLNVSGSASTAKNMVVTGISQLAKQAGFSSKYRVSNDMISGVVKDIWSPSNVAGSKITVNYDGKDYEVDLAGDFTFNKGDDISKITDALNEKIETTTGLAGNVKFGYSDGKVTLTKTGTSTADIKITSGSTKLLSGLGLSTVTPNGNILEGGATNTDDLFKNTLTADSTLDVKINGSTYTLSIPANTEISADTTLGTKSVQAVLDEAIRSNTDLSGKLKVTVGADGAVSFTKADGTTDGLSITGGSQNLLQGLGLKQTDGSITTSGTYNREKLVSSYLGDSLAGSTLTVSLDGVDKYITFKESDKNTADGYSTPEKLAAYIQKGLTAAYGKVVSGKDASGNDISGQDKVKVEFTNGMLSFTSPVAASVISIESSDASGVLGKNGALGIYAGETNRINTSKDLKDIQENLSSANTLTESSSDGTYGITINDKTFTFKKTDTIDTIMKTINNDSQANVTVAYSTINNTFSVTAKNGGSGSRVDIANVGTGNLATVLFGTVPTKDASGNYIENADAYSLQKPQDAKMTVSFDGNAANAIEIVRTENKFTLDGVDFELLSQTDGTVSSSTPIKFSVDNKTDDLYTKIKDFVDDYNAIIKLTNDKVSERKDTDATYAPLTDSQKADMSETEITNWEAKAKKGLLQGDSILNTLSLDLRKSMTDQVASMKTALYQIGIATKANDYSANGQLTIDEDKLKDALTNDPDKVASLFTSEDGIASRMQDVINKNIKTYGGDGILIEKAGIANSTTVDDSALTKTVTDCNTKIKELKALLETQQEQYYAKFTKLEQYLSTMNSQSSLFTTTASS